MMYKIIGVLLILTINNTFSYESTIKSINCPKYCECNEIMINPHQIHNQIGSTQLINSKSKLHHNLMLNVKCINTEYLIKLQNKNIYKLDISNINIKKFNLNIINNLYNLHILNASHNAIVDLSNTITLTQLTHVYLQNNNISTISYTFLPQSIKYIDISYNNLNYIPENFNNLLKLQYLNLIGNQLLCTCFNYVSIENLFKRLIVVDYNTYCNDMLQWDQFNKNVRCIEGQGTHYLNDEEGSGDVESTVDSVDQQLKAQDLDNMIELSNNGGKLEDDDLNEFLPVISTESTTMKSTTMKNDDLIISGDKRVSDFFFNEPNKTRQVEEEEEESGSGDDQLSTSTTDYSDDLIIPAFNVTRDEITEYTSQATVGESTTKEDDDLYHDDADDDYGSGSGSGAIDVSDFDYDFIGSSSTTETTESGSSSTTERDELPIIFVNEVSSTTTTTTTTEATPSTEATSSTHATSTSTGSPIIVTEPPIIKVETKINTEVERVRISGDSTDNINEELGQVVKEANTSPSVGTYAFLTILVIVLVALIGYTVIKRRVNHQNQHNNNNQHLSTGRNGGTPDTTGNNGFKKKSMDDVDNDKYAHEMINMRNGDDDKTVALLNQENETKRKPNNGTVVNEKSPMMNDPDESHVDNQLSIPTPTTSADTQTPPTPSPRNLDSAAGNGAVEKVKITMTELTDSIPKTPVLVTRTKSFTKDGPQIIVTPNLNQRPNVQK